MQHAWHQFYANHTQRARFATHHRIAFAANNVTVAFVIFGNRNIGDRRPRKIAVVGKNNFVEPIRYKQLWCNRRLRSALDHPVITHDITQRRRSRQGFIKGSLSFYRTKVCYPAHSNSCSSRGGKQKKAAGSSHFYNIPWRYGSIVSGDIHRFQTSSIKTVLMTMRIHFSKIAHIAFAFFGGAVAAVCWAEDTIESLYQSACSNCHGKGLAGGQAQSLLDNDWHYAKTDSDIQAVIKNGIEKVGMPAFTGFAPDTLRGLQVYIREKAFYHHKDAQPKAQAPSPDRVYTTREHSFALQHVFSGTGELWAVEALPDGSLLVTQQDGTLWHYHKENGRQSITGVPEVRFFSQGGLLDVIAHPQYKNNGWLYLAFSHKNSSEAGMTRIVRGKIEKGQWTKQETIFAADDSVYLPVGHHYGSRLAFIGTDLFFSVGERGQMLQAQDLSSPLGKIHRLHDDGRIPHDNPFVTVNSAMPSIWSYGHRNPQGLIATREGILWQTEHGPRGGDELNIISRGANYGWPLVSYGMNYDGTAFEWQPSPTLLTDPVYYWTPSPGISNLALYDADEFPNWKGNLLVTSLGKEELHRLSLHNNAVSDDEIILENQGRIRDIFIDPNGDIFLVINPEQKGGAGAVYKMIPSSSKP